MLKWILAILLLGFVAALILPRVLPTDAARWTVDPVTVKPDAKPNNYLVAGHDAVPLSVTASEAFERIDAVAMARPRVSRVAQDGTMATYMQRSAVFGFPDYVSVHAQPDGDGSLLSIYSRSRFGHSDLGVNKARVENWLADLQSNTDTK